jgi:shikimate kinase
MGVEHSVSRRPSSVVVIIGLPGVGKSTIGRRAAKRLGWSFVDLDHAIEERTGRSVREIFATSGESSFRDIESEVLRTCLESETPCLVSAGGGIILREPNRTILENAAAVVWMTASIDELELRLKPRSAPGRSHRPLLDGDLRPRLEKLVEEREHLYAKVATIELSTDGRAFDDVVDDLVNRISDVIAVQAPERVVVASEDE